MIKKIVKFIKHWHVYQAGEVAAFPPNHAARLIKSGYALDGTPAPEKDGMALKNIASESAKVKAIMAAPQTKDIKPDQNKSPKKRGRPSRKKK